VSGKNKKWPGPFFETLSDDGHQASVKVSVSKVLVSEGYVSGLSLMGPGLVNIPAAR